MNADGDLYRGEAEIAAARARGERLYAVPEEMADKMQALPRSERRELAKSRGWFKRERVK